MRNDDNSFQYLTKDFIFMPEQWGFGEVNDTYVRQAGQANFPDNEGQNCPATMADVFLGANEPDITGSCMGNMMGTCTASCTAGEVAAGCPMAQLKDLNPAAPLPNGHCDCWTQSYATGVGFWPLEGCSQPQPLPNLFNDTACVDAVMAVWRTNAAIALAAKGYKYLAAPLMAVNMEWMADFVRAACTGCSDISCGCPSHVGWHFYASDCRPVETGGYAALQHNLDATKALMGAFPHLQGAIINEVGMLNCYMEGDAGGCIPNGPNQKYPAINQPNHACPSTSELPNGLASFVESVIDMIIKTGTTEDGRSIVASFSWFNEDMAGGTYNLRLLDDEGQVNSLGYAYMAACTKWAASLGINPT